MVVDDGDSSLKVGLSFWEIDNNRLRVRVHYCTFGIALIDPGNTATPLGTAIAVEDATALAKALRHAKMKATLCESSHSTKL